MTTWTCGRHMKRDIKEGVYTISVADAELRPIAHTPFAFYAEPKSGGKGKKMPHNIFAVLQDDIL